MNRTNLIKGGLAVAVLAILGGGETLRNMNAQDTRAIITRDYDACNFDSCREQIAAEASNRLKGPDASVKDVELVNKRIADIDRRLAN